MLELLVVIGVIVVLTVLIIPGIKMATTKVKTSGCAANLRQIHIALMAYAADNNGFIPGASDRWGPPNPNTWCMLVWSYAGYNSDRLTTNSFDSSGTQPKNIFHCPANATGFRIPPTVTEVNSHKYSYGLNSGPMGDNQTGWQTPCPLARIKSPSQTVILSEASYCLGSRMGYIYYQGLIPHNGASNFLFFDGHVECVPFETTIKNWTDHTDAIFWMNN